MQPAYRIPAARKPSVPVVRPTPAQTLKPTTLALIGGALVVFLFGALVLAVGLGVGVVYASGRILPGVSAAGVALGNLTLDDAAAQLTASWQQIALRDGNRTWNVQPATLGLTLDAQATALEAQRRGRNSGSFLAALLGHEDVAPVVQVDAAKLQQSMKALASSVNMPAANATIRIVNGQLTPVAAVNGRLLDAGATVSRLVSAPGAEMADGALDLVMNSVAPTVTDASALMEKARALLAAPLIVNVFDPITNQTVTWSAPPDQWSQWLTTENSPSGVALSLDGAAFGNYLNGQNGALDGVRYIDVAQSVKAMQAAVAAGRSSASVRVYHKATQYTVQPGDTLGTLSWKFGFPMFRLVRANPNVNMDALSVGQTITIPSKDDLLPLPVVFNKRIVVSISKQHMWVYENGDLKWDWVASTGIPDSPTMPGVFQVQSHEKNAYAGNWNLYMPYFMGIYDAVPGFTNGIHGFPSRGGYQILWQNSLGHPVTYGCILLSTQNAQALYDWAEEGVVVEIQA
jgi:lipoprotein-anchoring transpeptidase ErfK/SrfK